MADREKVIKGLTDIHDEAYDRWVHCQYTQDKLLMLIDKTIPDALAMLQEQEPVRFKVTRQRLSYPFWDVKCDGCGYETSTSNVYGYKTSTIHEGWKYCPACGRRIKWDAGD